MKKTTLTDRAIKATRAGDKAYDKHDAVVPGLALSVLPSGFKRFVLIARFPGLRHPTRRALGTYGALTLAPARDKARAWLDLIGRGIDPAREIERERREQERQQRTNFAAAVDAYLKYEIDGPDPDHPLKRSARQIRGTLIDILVPVFGQRPIAEITADDYLSVFESVKSLGTDRALIELGARKKLRRSRKGQASPTQARMLFTNTKMLLNWALDRGGYGLDRNPLDRVSKLRRFGAPVERDRTLTDEELTALVLATERLSSPARQGWMVLMHSGLRLNEAAEARWSEIDGDAWTIPAMRMKGKNSGKAQARPHAVPLTNPLRQIFDAMPRGERDDFVFSNDGGAKPILLGTSRLKRKIDAEMLRILRQRAAARGENPDRVTLTPWRNHDVRRTCRTTLSRLGVAQDVAEAVLAHKRSGVVGVYDQWHRFPEKREALEKWSAFLAGLLRPRLEAETESA